MVATATNLKKPRSLSTDRLNKSQENSAAVTSIKRPEEASIGRISTLRASPNYTSRTESFSKEELEEG